jgi:hypothetical protein
MLTILLDPTHFVLDRDIHDYFMIYLPSIVVVITFFLGYWISNRINKNQETRRLIRVYNYFKVYLERQNKSIQHQISLFEKQIEKVNKLVDMSGLTIPVATPLYFIVDPIKKEEVFYAWTEIMKKDSQEFINTLQILEYTKMTFDNFVKYHHDFIERQNDIRLRWNSKLFKFQKMRASFNSHPQIASDPNIKKLNEIYDNWTSGDESSLKRTVDELTKPLLSHFYPIYSKNPGNRMALKLIRIAQDIDMIYKEWEFEITAYKITLQGIIDESSNEFKKIPSMSDPKKNALFGIL